VAASKNKNNNQPNFLWMPDVPMPDAWCFLTQLHPAAMQKTKKTKNRVTAVGLQKTKTTINNGAPMCHQCCRASSASKETFYKSLPNDLKQILRPTFRKLGAAGEGLSQEGTNPLDELLYWSVTLSGSRRG